MTTRILERHIQQKAANQEWVYECLQGKTKYFPYCPDETRKATVLPPFFPDEQSDAHITPADEPSPLYLTNIPMGRLPPKLSIILNTRPYSSGFELNHSEQQLSNQPQR